MRKKLEKTNQEKVGRVFVLLTVIVALVLCVLEITVLVVASPMMKPSFLLSFLPEPPKSKQILAYVIFSVFIIAMIGGIIYVGMDGVRSGCGFWKLTLQQIVRLVAYPFLCMMTAGIFMLF